MPLARALGLGHGMTRKAAQIEVRVKEVLRRTGLMIVIDEAHFFFSQGPRMWARPEMLDWIDTALCNPPLPVALITTPRFMVCGDRAARHVGWNSRQFRRRSRYWLLSWAQGRARDPGTRSRAQDSGQAVALTLPAVVLAAAVTEALPLAS